MTDGTSSVSGRRAGRFRLGAGLAGLWLGAAGVAACAADSNTGDGRLAASIVGREFVSQDVAGRVLVAGTQIAIRFQRDDLSASAGCNALGAPYRLDEIDATSGALIVDASSLATTDMGCDPARSTQDAWLADFLLSHPTLTVAGGRLSLAAGQVVVHLLDRDIADPDRPLVGTRWVVDTVLRGDVAESVPAGSDVTLVLGDDGELVATSPGCTSAAVPYERVDGRLELTDFVVDSIGCPPPWADTIALLRATSVDVTIEHARLTLRSTSIGLSLVAVGEP
jgi:heat shock protein HslJ